MMITNMHLYNLEFYHKYSNQYFMQFLSPFEKLSNQQLLKELAVKKHEKCLDQCLQIIRQIQRRNFELSSQVSSMIKYLKFLNQRISIAQSYLDKDTKGWRVDHKKSQNSRMTIHSKHSNNEVHLSIEGQAFLDVVSIASFIFETDLYPQWMPLCKFGQDSLEVGIGQKVAYSQFNFPLMPKRGGFIYGSLVDRLKQNNSIILYFQGVTLRKQCQQVFGKSFSPKASVSPIQVRLGIIEASQIAPNKFKFRAYSIIDVKFSINFLPGGILGLFTKTIVGHIFDNLIKKTQKMEGSEWQKRIKKDQKQFYKLIESKDLQMKQGIIKEKL